MVDSPVSTKCYPLLINSNTMKSAYQEIKDISQIKGSFEGYYWYSDKSKPVLVEDSPIDPSWFTELPFVIEANFYDKKQQISIQIRNIDGYYHMAKIDLSSVPKEALDTQWYIAHDLEGKEGYLMIEAWEEENDPLLDEMPVYQPSWAAFAGFSQ